MTEGAHQRGGFSAIEGREAKAEKILAILEAAGRPLSKGQKVLDLGTGSGAIAAALNRKADVFTTDTLDQRTAGKTLPFAITNRDLPFPDASFDLVVSNHVIEHTEDPSHHLREIRRILKPDGVVYLATPNRWWPWEVHAHLPLLHYLPWHTYYRLGQTLGRLHEPVRLMSLPLLARETRNVFHLKAWHPRILKDPAAYALSVPLWARQICRWLPQRILTATASLQPTLIVLLSPK